MSLLKLGLLLAAATVHEAGEPIDMPAIELPPVRESGLASWYGDGKMHGRITANGEHVAPDAFTCAHRTLPFDTTVLLVNRRDPRRRTWCRINDRGPYGAVADDGSWQVGAEGGARYRGVLDITVEAAKELGTHGKGLEPIEIRYWTSDTRLRGDLALVEP